MLEQAIAGIRHSAIFHQTITNATESTQHQFKNPRCFRFSTPSFPFGIISELNNQAALRVPKVCATPRLQRGACECEDIA